MSSIVELSGTVEDLFGHRFTLKTADGKKLVDLGPGGEHEHQLKAGQEITVEGEDKPGELKARKLRQSGGNWKPVGGKDAGKPHAPKPGPGDAHGGPHGAADDKKDHPHGEHVVSDEHVSKALNDAGYTDPGERVRKPKHVEVVATKNGKRFKVHVHQDGIKKADPAA